MKARVKSHLLTLGLIFSISWGAIAAPTSATSSGLSESAIKSGAEISRDILALWVSNGTTQTEYSTEYMKKFAGIVTWFDGPILKDSPQYVDWLRAQIQNHKKLIVLGSLGVRFGNKKGLKKRPELIKVHNKLFLIEEIYLGLDKSVFSERMFEQTLRSFDSDNVLWLINFVKARGEDAINQLFVYLKSVKEPRLQQSLLLLLDQTITRLSEVNEKILLDKIRSCQEALDVRLILKMLERQGHSEALPVLMDTASRLPAERGEIFDSIRLILGRI